METNESPSEQYERRRIVRNCIQLEGLCFQFNFEIMKYFLIKQNNLYYETTQKSLFIP